MNNVFYLNGLKTESQTSSVDSDVVNQAFFPNKIVLNLSFFKPEINYLTATLDNKPDILRISSHKISVKHPKTTLTFRV